MAENECLFCRIIGGEVQSTKVYEDNLAYAFSDIDPQAPTHLLIIPKEHLDLLGHLLRLAPKIANQQGIAENGYRTVINTGAQSGQSVEHLHLHVLGGRAMNWPPG
jgi:histidine triad (HIT) family protein